MQDTVKEKKRFVTGKSIIWFTIALACMTCYYIFINWGLMKVQGLDFYYLWNVGAE